MLKKREAAMGLNTIPALQSGPALNPHPTPSPAQSQPSTSYSPPALTSTLSNPSQPSLSFTSTPAPASSSGATEPHYGSSTSNTVPTGVSAGQLPGQLQGSHGNVALSHQYNGSASGGQQGPGSADLLDASVLADRGKAFDLFRWAGRQHHVSCFPAAAVQKLSTALLAARLLHEQCIQVANLQ